MTQYNRLSNSRIDGRLESAAQGLVVGTAEALPSLSDNPAKWYGIVLQFTGPSGPGCIRGHSYQCLNPSGTYEWVDITAEKAQNPSRVVVTDPYGALETSQATSTEALALVGARSPAFQTQIDGKVDKITGKGLSECDFTQVDKDKLSVIEDGAERNDIVEIQVNGVTVPPQAGRQVNLRLPIVRVFPIIEIPAGGAVQVVHGVQGEIGSVDLRLSDGTSVRDCTIKVRPTVIIVSSPVLLSDVRLYVVG